MRFEKGHISDWARSHSVAAGSFASQDDRWQKHKHKKREPWLSNENACHNKGNYSSHFSRQTFTSLIKPRQKF